MDERDQRYEELQQTIATLTARVYKLEQQAGLRSLPRESTSILTEAPVSQPAPDTNAELESRIGGHWMNRVGIVAVLIGVSYFLKYAFDNAWIGAAGRVSSGLVGGLGIVFWSEFVRKRGHGNYSFSLKAVGIGILYLSLWASAQLYALVPNSLAFFAMTSVTAATAAMSLWQNSEVIAAFAAAGAFITPVALSTGENNAAGLFAYLAILDLCALFLMRYRPWFRVLTGSYVGTFLLYAGWHNQFYSPEQFWITFAATSVFFGTFLAVPLLQKNNSDDKISLVVALANGAVYFLQVYELFIHRADTRPTAIIAVALSFLYFLLARQLGRRGSILSAQVHWALAVSLLVVAVPIGLEAKWITTGWLLEAGALVWISRRNETNFLKYFGLTALALGVCRLVLLDQFDTTRLIINERMFTYAVAIVVMVVIARSFASSDGLNERQTLPFLIVTINVLALLALNYEIADTWRRYLQQSDPDTLGKLKITRDFAYSALWMVYGAGLMFAGFWKQSRFLRWQALTLIAVTIGKVFLYDTLYIDRGYRILSLIILGLLLLTTSFFYQRDVFKLKQH